MTRMTVLAVGLAAAALLGGCGGGDAGVAAGAGDGETPVTGSPGAPTGPGVAGQGSAAGVVRDGSGAVVAGVLVVPVSLDEPANAVPERAVVTGADGTYRWELPAGKYELGALRDGEQLGSTRVEVAAGRTVTADIDVG